MAWWNENKIRMIQNNLREVDVQMDPEKYAETIEGFGANVAMIGAGGISALYPTELPYARVSPFLKSDFVGEVVRECHKRNIRVIVRFDISKVDAKLVDEHPDWFVRNDNNEFMTYSGTVAACVNGPYLQKHIFEIISETVNRYPVDGIFFNAFSFGSWDYDGNRCSICRCENCRKRFFEYSGMELPARVDTGDPIYLEYQKFQKLVLKELLDRVRELVRGINPDIAVCTYNYNVDMVRNESNTSVSRPLPFWIYASSDNVATVTETFEDEGKISANCVINSVDFFSRFMGVSEELTKLRLYGNMANGGALDWCIIGSFEDYPDRKAYGAVREVFNYHKRYEDIFAAIKPDARILLVKGNKMLDWTGTEYNGIFTILKEAHLIFRVVDVEEIDRFADRLDEFDTIILPNVELNPDSGFAMALAGAKARVIATGLSMRNTPELLHKLFGVKLAKPPAKARGHYLLTTPKEVFRSFADTEWVYLDMDYSPVGMDEGNRGILPLVTTAPFGPPEFCYGHEVTDEMTISVKDDRMIYIPFMLGILYYRHGFKEFKHMLTDIINAYGGTKKPFITNAPSCVEMFWHRCSDGKHLLQMLNLSGYNGTSVEEALPIHNVSIELNGLAPTRIIELKHDGEEEILPRGTGFNVPILDTYKAFILEVEPS